MPGRPGLAVAVEARHATLPPGLIDRLRGALASVRPVRSAAPEDAASAPARALAPPAAAVEAVIFVAVLGLSAAALEEVVDAVTREGRGTEVSPVFLTDSLDFEPFARRRLRFEYIPDGGRRQRFAPDLDWGAYERRRYRLLALKWRPQSLISFGTPPPRDCAAAIEPPA